MKKIAVTGGMGFLGQHLVKELVTNIPDADITVLDMVKNPFIDESLNKLPNLRIIGGVDITSDNFGTYVEGMDIVYHLAAMISFWRKDRDEMIRVNVLGSENVARACLEKGVKRFIYVSSTAALGYNNNRDNPMDENYKFDWRKGKGFEYMLSKYFAEQKVLELCEKGLPALIANPSTMFGPQDTKGFTLIENLLAGKVPALLPGGYAVTDARDTARALRLMADKGDVGENYLLVGGNYTYREMLSVFAEVLGVAPPKITIPFFLGPVMTGIISLQELVQPSPPNLTREIVAPGFRYRYYSSRKAMEHLGWKPEISLEKTLSDTYGYYRKYLAEKGAAS